MKTVLQFSGGRDSLALLYMLEPFWDGVTVVWADGGDASDELHELQEHVERLVPNYARIKGRVKRDRAERGDPRGRDWLLCCSRNIWRLMDEYIVGHGVQWVLRGSKACDPIKVIEPNHTDARGITYMMPLWGWSDEKVEGYIAGRALKPVYPHDCQSCPVSKPCDRPELVKVSDATQALDIHQG